MRGTAQQPRLYVGMILILIFAEVLGKSWLLPIPIRTITSNHFPPHRSVRVDCCSSHELPLESSLLNERPPAAFRELDLESPMDCTYAILGSFPDVPFQHFPDRNQCASLAGEPDMIKLVRVQDRMTSETDESISAHLKVKIR